MKVTFDFKGFQETKAIGIAKHNRRDLSHIHGNIKDPDSTIPGGIDISKISNNLIRTDNFQNVSNLLNGRKVIGGIQKVTQEYTGFVISIGNVADGTLPKKELQKFFAATDKWVRKTFGEKYLMQSIEHYDEDLPKIKILMANIVEYSGDDDKKKGKVYLSSKHKFGFEGSRSINDVRLLAKKLELKFHTEVASQWSSFGVEPPSEQIGEQGKKSKLEFLQRKLLENTLKIDKNKAFNQRLITRHKDLVNKVNNILINYKVLAKVASGDQWSELMSKLKIKKEIEQQKLETFKNMSKEREQ